ncbi:MAG: glycosyl transferase [Rhodobacterales bacterium]|nr:MAG: glycosyl transferase [Rhodobacterales bacterium]
MAQIAFILLCHKDPQAIVRQAEQLTALGDFISIHFDARAPRSAFETIRNGLKDNPRVTYATKRIKCGWGEWSLVEATLYAIEAAVRDFPRATHFYMVSGDCMAIKSRDYAARFLDADDCDYVESFDFFESDWIKTGLKEERLIYRHWFNERTQKRRFYGMLRLQQWLGLTREIPQDIEVQIGSQWWCLRRKTIEAILEFTRTRPDVMRFFRTSWIPDETFFQTLVRHLVPRAEIRTRTLTFLMFSDYGMPVTFYNDHYDLLLAQDFLFARKISGEAKQLKERLGRLFASDQTEFQISGEGRSLFKFLTGQGRVGRRFAPRFWETEATLGRDRELLIVTCKKWHVAKRLVRKIREETGITALDYLFDEESTPLPDLGGIEGKLSKRARHRRALMRMLFDYHDTDRILICVDTVRLDLIEDFYSDLSKTRLLEIDCSMTDDYLIGHAMRVGLAGERTPDATMRQILPTIRQDVQSESERIRDKQFELFDRIREVNTPEENAPAIGRFLSVDDETAKRIAQTPHLFVD